MLTVYVIILFAMECEPSHIHKNIAWAPVTIGSCSSCAIQTQSSRGHIINVNWPARHLPTPHVRRALWRKKPHDSSSCHVLLYCVSVIFYVHGQPPRSKIKEEAHGTQEHGQNKTRHHKQVWHTGLSAVENFAKSDQWVEDAVVQPARKHGITVAEHRHYALQARDVRYNVRIRM